MSDRACGCGEVYGVGLAVCPRCRRDPNEGMAVSVTDELDRLTAENERLREEVDNATQVNAELLIDLPARLRGALIGVIAAYDSLYSEGEDADIDDRLRVRWERRVNAAIGIARRALTEIEADEEARP